MTPFDGLLPFAVLLYPVLITAGVGLVVRTGWRWVLFVSLAMAVVQFGHLLPLPGTRGAARELVLVALWAVAQLAIARLFLLRRAARRSRVVFAGALLASLAPLLAAKAAPLVAPGTTLGFLGLSYITFRALDAIIGIEDGIIRALPAGRYLTFLLFFPTISSGPVDRWRRFDADLDRRRTRDEVLDDADAAARRIALGLLYKFVLATAVQRWWLEPLTAASGVWTTVSYMYAYSAFLYLDFAGYSHLAIGTSYLFGIHTPENFNRPFLAPNIAEFWNRWHMSLSHWFRDHVYMRLVLSARKDKWMRNAQAASVLGFVVTFTLMGAWHGFEWHYLIYGLYHASLLSAHQLLSRWGRSRAWWGRGRTWRLASIFLTANLACFGFLIFSGRLG